MDPLASRYAITNRPLHHKKEAMRQVGTQLGASDEFCTLSYMHFIIQELPHIFSSL